MTTRSLTESDRERIISILIATEVFTQEEIRVAAELIDIVLHDPNQKDYRILCLVDGGDRTLGYICYGPAPMTQGTYDLYWIAVDPEVQDRGIGGTLVEIVENELRRMGARMILVDTSSLPSYDKSRRFYEGRGFREAARIPDYYFPGNDRITYWKPLRETA